ncbi:MAG: tyrosine-type recombinase/integrase [Blastocatellia bacterium]
MPRERKGFVYQDPKTRRWYARISFQDNLGKRREIRRRVRNKSEGKDMLSDLRTELRRKGSASVQAHGLLLSDLIEFYRTHYAKPAKYVGDRKVSGLRSHYDTDRKLERLCEKIGSLPLRSITVTTLKSYRDTRLQEPDQRFVKSGTIRQKSITSVNREMALLRRLLNVAQQEGWLLANPFSKARGLISAADETKRERVLSLEEEVRLLAVCTGPREHLSHLVQIAIDSGMRKGELLKLRASDVDLNSGVITVRAFNTKTMQQRTVAITPRVRASLEGILSKLPDGYDKPMFGVESVKRSFRTACRLAKIDDLRFHDLRHTCTTRLLSAGVPMEIVMKYLGHTQYNTTWRYFNLDQAHIKLVLDALGLDSTAA